MIKPGGRPVQGLRPLLAQWSPKKMPRLPLGAEGPVLQEARPSSSRTASGEGPGRCVGCLARGADRGFTGHVSGRCAPDSSERDRTMSRKNHLLAALATSVAAPTVLPMVVTTPPAEFVVLLRLRVPKTSTAIRHSNSALV